PDGQQRSDVIVSSGSSIDNFVLRPAAGQMPTCSTRSGRKARSRSPAWGSDPTWARALGRGSGRQLLRHGDRADEAGITRRRVEAAVIRVAARRVEGELKGSAGGSAAVAATSRRRAPVGASPTAGVADGGMRRRPVV